MVVRERRANQSSRGREISGRLSPLVSIETEIGLAVFQRRRAVDLESHLEGFPEA